MTDPVTPLHYTPNDNFVSGQYASRADGFTPSGVKALVWLDMSGGVTAAFKAAVESFARSSQVYGFYLADERSPSATIAANFKAGSDWNHANFLLRRRSLSSETQAVD